MTTSAHTRAVSSKGQAGDAAQHAPSWTTELTTLTLLPVRQRRPMTLRFMVHLSPSLAPQPTMQAVPTADVVVTNPTHYAVALKYEPTKYRAPRVVAKGRDLMALEIRRLAQEHNVPLFEAPPLARAIYGTTDIDREIPQGLYVAVAQVLSYVFQIRSLTPHRAARLRRPAPVVGAEFEKYVTDADDGSEDAR